MLHLIFQSPIESAILERIGSEDDVVFLENAVLRLLSNNNTSRRLIGNRLCVLSDDLAVRGITPDELVKGVEVIDYAELVELTVNNPTIQSWV